MEVLGLASFTIAKKCLSINEIPRVRSKACPYSQCQDRPDTKQNTELIVCILHGLCVNTSHEPDGWDREDVALSSYL